MKAIRLVCLIFSVLLTGCIGVKYLDIIPYNSPKGYVEFYCVNEGNITKSWEIPTNRPLVHGTVNNKEVFYGKVPHTGKKDIHKVLRVYKSPGNYTFSISIFQSKDPYKIKVKENMVTPVVIVFTNITKSIPIGKRKVMERTFVYVKVYTEEPVYINNYVLK